ncbi:MAG: hypothetical protein ACOCQD_02215 [archaeon]
MIPLSQSQIIEVIKKFDKHVQGIKEEVFKISWYMRGGVSSHDLFWVYSSEDRKIMSEIIKENITHTKDSGLPLL